RTAVEGATPENDILGAGLVLWEALTGRTEPRGEEEAIVEPPSRHVLGVPRELDDVVLCATQCDPRRRFANAREMARLLEGFVGGAITSEISAWVERNAREVLSQRAEMVAAIEREAAAEAAAMPDLSPPNSSDLKATVPQWKNAPSPNRVSTTA